MKGSRWPVALTVAGSDPSGGAGLQADLKTFAALKTYGAAAVTAVTSQNTLGVRAIHLIPPAMVAGQVQDVLSDLPVAAIKTGMLGGIEQLEALVQVLRRHPGIPLVVDPVIHATSGASLLVGGEAPERLVRELLPLADLITPNLAEARLLAADPELPARALADRLLGCGPAAVLITGGDDPGEKVTDLLVTAAGQQIFTRPRVATASTHGTGCTLSAAVTAGLAHGAPMGEAVAAAVAYVQRALETAWPLGRGHGPVHHMHACWGDTP